MNIKTNTESIIDIDDELKKIPFFQIHKEMLPFIGNQFYEMKDDYEEDERRRKVCKKSVLELLRSMTGKEISEDSEDRNFAIECLADMNKGGVLLVGENCYIGSPIPNDEIKEYYDRDWYKSGLPAGFPTPFYLSTRLMIPFAPLMAHRPLNNVQQLIREHIEWCGLDTNLCALKDIERYTFMPYYLRPAIGQKEFSPTEEDLKISCEVLCEVVKILKPKEVWFKTDDTFQAFIKEHGTDMIGDIKVSCYLWPYPTIKF